MLSSSKMACGQLCEAVCTLLKSHLNVQILHATFAGSALCQTSSDSLNDLPSELSGGEAGDMKEQMFW